MASALTQAIRWSLTVSLAVTWAATAAQSPNETSAIRKLGSEGFLVWLQCKADEDHGPIYRYDLDGTGVVTPRKIVDDAWGATVSGDGAYLAYTTSSDGGLNVDIWVAGADGTNPRRLLAQPMPYVAWLKFGLPENKLSFTSGATSRRDDCWATSNVYFADLTGNVRRVMQNFNWGDANYFDFVDNNHNTISFRFRGKYSYTLETTDGATKTFSDVSSTECMNLGQRCSSTLSPSGDSLILNWVSHTGMEIHVRTKRDGLSWVKKADLNNFPFKTTDYRWVNTGEWVTMRQEGSSSEPAEFHNRDIYAHNIKTGDHIRLTFNEDVAHKNSSATLFLGKAAPTTVAPLPLRVTRASPVRSDDSRLFTVNGVRVPRGCRVRAALLRPAEHMLHLGRGEGSSW